LTPTIATDAVEGFVGGFLVLMGAPGTGKTIAACKWCWAKRGLFYRVAEISRMDWYRNDEIDNVCTCPNLVLDDLGAEYDDERGNWRSKLDAIINERYDRGSNAATMITSNYGPTRLMRYVGVRTWQRLTEAGRIVQCTGASLRRVEDDPEPGEADTCGNPRTKGDRHGR
jgi:DNA replication protein DnaC